MTEPELILINGRISTLDADQSEVQGLASQAGRIVAPGSESDITKLAGDTTRAIYLHDRRAIPGIIDSHCHPNNVPARSKSEYDHY